MNNRYLVAAALIGLACAAPVRAEDRPDPMAAVESLLRPEVMLRGVVREEDVSLLFAQLRAELVAAQLGREAPPPVALERRAGEIAAELRVRGAAAGLVLLGAFEAAARQAVHDVLSDPAGSGNR